MPRPGRRGISRSGATATRPGPLTALPPAFTGEARAPLGPNKLLAVLERLADPG
ncbi:hypothetical protein ACWEVP_27140 [Amycolatopsis sp. NPDC003865]